MSHAQCQRVVALRALTNRSSATIALHSSLLAALWHHGHRLRTRQRQATAADTPGVQVVKVSRRQFVSTMPAVFGGTSILSACSPASDPQGYEAVAASTWRASPLAGVEGAALTRELVHCATLAPSSHNTQCWRFVVEDKAIAIRPDPARRCPVVDPDAHHLFVTLGCAAENLVQAALAHGLVSEPSFDATHGLVRVTLAPATARASPLFLAIASRQCTRGDYDGQPLSRQDLNLLERADTSNGVRMLLVTDRPAMERVLKHVVQGNTAQLGDPAFVRELKSWIRFNVGYLRTPMPADASAAAQADAHACLLDALGIRRAAVMGGSAGAPSALQMGTSPPGPGQRPDPRGAAHLQAADSGRLGGIHARVGKEHDDAAARLGLSVLGGDPRRAQPSAQGGPGDTARVAARRQPLRAYPGQRHDRQHPPGVRTSNHHRFDRPAQRPWQCRPAAKAHRQVGPLGPRAPAPWRTVSRKALL